MTVAKSSMRSFSRVMVLSDTPIATAIADCFPTSCKRWKMIDAVLRALSLGGTDAGAMDITQHEEKWLRTRDSNPQAAAYETAPCPDYPQGCKKARWPMTASGWKALRARGVERAGTGRQCRQPARWPAQRRAAGKGNLHAKNWLYRDSLLAIRPSPHMAMLAPPLLKEPLQPELMQAVHVGDVACHWLRRLFRRWANNLGVQGTNPSSCALLGLALLAFEQSEDRWLRTASFAGDCGLAKATLNQRFEQLLYWRYVHALTFYRNPYDSSIGISIIGFSIVRRP